MSDQTPDFGAPRAAPGPESETGAGDTEVFANAEFATGERNGGEFTGGAAPKRSGKRVAAMTALGLGYAVLATGTAFGVIAVKSPAPVDVTAVNASAYAAPPSGASGSAAAGTGKGAKPTSAQRSRAPRRRPRARRPRRPPPSRRPARVRRSTVTGSVSDGVHSGDLRYFLLPPPQGQSSVQGDPNGNTETLDDVVTNDYGGDSSIKTYLQQDGFKTACDRVYQDSTIGANVQIELIKFGSSSESSAWLSGATFNGGGYQSISVPGESGATRRAGATRRTASYDADRRVPGGRHLLPGVHLRHAADPVPGARPGCQRRALAAGERIRGRR